MPRVHTTNDRERIDAALDLIRDHGATDGAHHKMWVIDQVVRILTGPDYAHWVATYQDGEDGPETYPWETGIAP